MTRPAARPPVRPTAVLLGADVGGSHTTVVVARGPDEILARAEGPGAVMKSGGGPASAAIILDAARRAAVEAGVALPVDAMVVGAAGAGRPSEQGELAAALADAARRVRVLGDAEVALTAAFAESPGILINAGTGSIAFARDAQGGLHRRGGHGWQLGDEGGGYWLGRRALAAAGRAQDGREEGSTLLARLLGALGLAEFDDLVRWTTTATPAHVAGLAPQLLAAARDGEAVPRRIVEEAARELAALVVTLGRHFPDADPVPVAAAGSLLAPTSPLLPAFRTALAAAFPRARLREGPVDALRGALTIALALGTKGAPRG